MKRIVEENDGQGLEGLLGEKVLLMCMNYFYSGKLLGVNEHDVILEDARIVYDTGKWSSDSFTTAETIGPKEWFVRTSTIESYGRMDK